ncbi:antitoxin [Leifsonia sp. ZF2019]|uniref:antitoxin n=1 Tax=Leifsonia sp. ZF2019 TaxID=2781978 RepID=UPI001CBD2B39|nr:antitoxin [Leifsonia sp. ZF2019]UAJ80055.1 antitoxin [Leifsonia sp. ZF2019]
MGVFDDLERKAEDLLKGSSAQDSSHDEDAPGEQKERGINKVLDGVADAANHATRGAYEKQIDGARDTIEKKLGGK